jgi:hypothetical protein
MQIYSRISPLRQISTRDRQEARRDQTNATQKYPHKKSADSSLSATPHYKLDVVEISAQGLHALLQSNQSASAN